MKKLGITMVTMKHELAISVLKWVLGQQQLLLDATIIDTDRTAIQESIDSLVQSIYILESDYTPSFATGRSDIIHKID